jgi:hypothetical protein
MKKEMLKFVEENLEVIKDNFYASEESAIMNDDFCDEDDLVFLIDELDCIGSAEELIDLINERSLGVDYDNEDDAQELFDMIKALKEATN